MSQGESTAGKPAVRPQAVSELRRRLVQRYSDSVVATGQHLALMGYGQTDLFGVDPEFLASQSDTDRRIPGSKTLTATNMQIDERLAQWPVEARRMYSLMMGLDLPATVEGYEHLDYAALMALPSPPPMTLDDIDPNHNVISAEIARVAVEHAEQTVAHLKDAELFVADHEMCALLRTAQQTLPSQPLLLTDPLSEAGFVYFPEPISDPDSHGLPVGVHALSWQVTAHGAGKTDREGKPLTKVTLYAWVSPQGINAVPEIHPLDVLTAMMRQDPLPLLVAWRYEWLVGEPHDTRTPTPLTRLGLADPKKVDKDFQQAEWFTAGFHQRLAIAFWTIARQPLTATTEEPIARPLRRKYARAGIRTGSNPVRVVRFRTREDAHASATADMPLASDATDSGNETGSGETEPGRVYRHRWVVRGFWRNQWYASLGTHRAVWISAHIRGPEGAPLLGAERVFLVEGS